MYKRGPNGNRITPADRAQARGGNNKASGFGPIWLGLPEALFADHPTPECRVEPTIVIFG
ncbi:MAG: hypothetical protein NVS2B7_05080 [Herpetosiphon sp.]